MDNDRNNRDVLISRVVDGEATPRDWGALEDISAGDPGVWRELASAQRQQAELARCVEVATEAADRVDLPGDDAPSIRLSARLNLAARWAGWAAAAMVALAWVGAGGPAASTTDVQSASLLPASLGSDAALSLYLDKGKQEGRVLAEMPAKMLVGTRPAADGFGYEVVFVRQIVERTRVNDLYRLSSDEFGNAAPVPVRGRRGARSPM